MAKRVAAQRRGLLYGLLATIFVAVILLVLLIWQMNETEKLRRVVANPADPSAVTDTAKVQSDLRAQLNKLRDLEILPAEGSNSIYAANQALLDRVNLCREDVGKLVYDINGQGLADVHGQALHNQVRDVSGTVQQILARATEALKVAPSKLKIGGTSVSSPETLTQAIRDLSGHIDALAIAYGDRVNDINKLQQDLAGAKQTGQTEVQNLTTKFDELSSQKDERIAKLEKDVADALAQTDRERQQYEEARQQHNEYVNQVKAQTNELNRKIAMLDSQIKVLADRIQRAQAREFEPDGMIVKLSPGEDTGYVNLGRGAGVFNGMTFSVFDPRELSKEKPQPKGTIRLTNVMENSSEFGITETLHRSDPIVEGDIITNPAFDLERPFHFAVVGKFDINGDKVDDTDWIKSKIRDFGGKVQDKVTVQTDYLVVGDDPMSWAPQTGGQPSPQQQAVIDRLQKEQQAFGEATDLARRLHIPVLNTNRFLSLIGMAPPAGRAAWAGAAAK